MTPSAPVIAVAQLRFGAEVAADEPRAQSAQVLGRAGLRVADDRDDVVATGAQEARDAAADEPGGTGDDDRSRRHESGPPSAGSVDRRVRSDRLEPGLDRPQEGGRLGAVVRPVVDGEDHVHDRADGDDVAVGRLEHDGALGDRLHGQDRDLRDVDDRHRQVRAEPAGVVDRERAAAVVLEAELARPGARGDLGDRAVQAADRELVDVADDRHEEPVVDGDGDAHVDPPLGQEAVSVQWALKAG